MKFLKSMGFWVIIAFSCFCATIPLTGWMAVVSCLLGHACMVTGYAIAQNEHYKAFYELFKELKGTWRKGVSSKWNIKLLMIIGIVIFFASVILALVISNILWIVILLSLAIVDIWMIICILSYWGVDQWLLKKYEKKYGKIE